MDRRVGEWDRAAQPRRRPDPTRRWQEGSAGRYACSAGSDRIRMGWVGTWAWVWPPSARPRTRSTTKLPLPLPQSAAAAQSRNSPDATLLARLRISWRRSTRRGARVRRPHRSLDGETAVDLAAIADRVRAFSLVPPGHAAGAPRRHVILASVHAAVNGRLSLLSRRPRGRRKEGRRRWIWSSLFTWFRHVRKPVQVPHVQICSCSRGVRSRAGSFSSVLVCIFIRFSSISPSSVLVCSYNHFASVQVFLDNTWSPLTMC